jgi:hypothetical protein
LVWRASDRAQRRGVFVFGLLLIALVGFIIAMTAEQPGAKHAGVVIAASGSIARQAKTILLGIYNIRGFPMWLPGLPTTLPEIISEPPVWLCKYSPTVSPKNHF